MQSAIIHHLVFAITYNCARGPKERRHCIRRITPTRRPPIILNLHSLPHNDPIFCGLSTSRFCRGFFRSCWPSLLPAIYELQTIPLHDLAAYKAIIFPILLKSCIPYDDVCVNCCLKDVPNKLCKIHHCPIGAQTIPHKHTPHTASLGDADLGFSTTGIRLARLLGLHIEALHPSATPMGITADSYLSVCPASLPCPVDLTPPTWSHPARTFKPLCSLLSPLAWFPSLYAGVGHTIRITVME